MTFTSEHHKLHGKEGLLNIPPGNPWLSALSASASSSEGKTYSKKKTPPQSTHYGFLNTSWARFERTNKPNTKSCFKGSWTQLIEWRHLPRTDALHYYFVLHLI